MNPIDIRIRGVLERVRLHDPELYAELDRHRRSAVARLRAANLIADLGFLGLDAETALDAVTLPLVRPTLNPVLRVLNGEPVLEFPDAESEVWRKRLMEAHDNLVRAVAATGRIEITGGDGSWVGTGFLVREDVVVTAQHVAFEFATGKDKDFVFRFGDGDVRMTASLDCLEEFGNDKDQSRTYRIVKILHLEPDKDPDVALLQVEPNPSNPIPGSLDLAETPPQEGDFVAAIGYPARDSTVQDQERMEIQFGHAYDKKRLSPGEITGGDANVLRHDCLTLSKSSGSSVVSLATGDVVGVHFQGANLKENRAIPSIRILELLHLAGRGLAPRGAGAYGREVGFHDRRVPAPLETRTLPGLGSAIQVTVTVGDASPNGVGDGE